MQGVNELQAIENMLARPVDGRKFETASGTIFLGNTALAQRWALMQSSFETKNQSEKHLTMSVLLLKMHLSVRQTSYFTMR